MKFYQRHGSNYIPTLLIVLSLSLISLTACAAKQKEQTTLLPSPNGEIRATTNIPGPDSVAPDTIDTTQQPDTGTSGPDASATHVSALEKVGFSSTASAMLQSVGRSPDQLQPEPGFILSVPPSVGDGEAFLIEFGAVGVQKVVVNWRNKTLVLPTPGPSGTFQALLPVSLDEKSQNHTLEMSVEWANGKTEVFKAKIPVKKRTYPVQKLKVASKYVSPPAAMQAKIKQDRAEMRAAIGKVTPHQYWSLPLLRPVPGEVTSLYGLRREFNGVPKAPHKGVDFDGKEGDPIAAAEDGVVVLVAEHYYGGNTVVVDHGLGVFSVYLHLSGFAVQPGQKVTRGETVGLVGRTGRVTGPHLHLSFYVLGDSVNAAPCLEM